MPCPNGGSISASCSSDYNEMPPNWTDYSVKCCHKFVDCCYTVRCTGEFVQTGTGCNASLTGFALVYASPPSGVGGPGND